MCLSPTSSGKSFILFLLCEFYKEKRKLIVVPDSGLVEQLYSDFNDYNKNQELSSQKINMNYTKDVTENIVISTWQSISHFEKSYFNQFDVIMFDEAHSCTADSLISIMEKCENVKYRFGFTGSIKDEAIPYSLLVGLFGKIYKVISTKELMDIDEVSQLDIKCIIFKHKSKKFIKPKKIYDPNATEKTPANYIYEAETNFIVSHTKRNKFIINLANSLEGNTLILYKYIDRHGIPLYNMYNELNNKSETPKQIHFINGSVDVIERDNIRKLVDKSENSVIIASVGTFSQGINLPNLHNIIFAHAGKSKIKIIQQIGRGLRKHFSKTKCTLYDLSDYLYKDCYSYRHLVERLKIYEVEEFKYKIHQIEI